MGGGGGVGRVQARIKGWAGGLCGERKKGDVAGFAGLSLRLLVCFFFFRCLVWRVYSWILIHRYRSPSFHHHRLPPFVSSRQQKIQLSLSSCLAPHIHPHPNKPTNLLPFKTYPNPSTPSNHPHGNTLPCLAANSTLSRWPRWRARTPRAMWPTLPLKFRVHLEALLQPRQLVEDAVHLFRSVCSVVTHTGSGNERKWMGKAI